MAERLGEATMVNNGSSEAAEAERRARRNALARRRYGRRKYEKLIVAHPAVQALGARMNPEAPTAPAKRGVPKLIAEATKDGDVATAVASLRRVMKCHRRTGDIARKRLRREEVFVREQWALLRQRETIGSVVRASQAPQS